MEYIVRYDDPSGGYIVIQSGGLDLLHDAMTGWETYTTASGLTLYFEPRPQELPQSARRLQFALVEAPDGTRFSLASNLSLDLKALAEELVPIQ